VAGTVLVLDTAGRETLWSAAGWLFDLVVLQLAQSVSSETLRVRLMEIEEQNLGALVLADFEESDRVQLLDAIRRELIDRIDRVLPADFPGRASALPHVKQLVDLVG
jgi:hypothetical protein